MTEHPGQNAFQPTRWTLVARATEGREGTPAKLQQEALESLCRLYWTPLFVFVRRQGHTPEEAEDLIQGFFAKILEKQFFASADSDKGRLRNFLLNALKRYLVDEHRARNAEKRGGRVMMVPVDAVTGEHSGAWQIASRETPEHAYQHRWVCTLLEHCLERLRGEYSEQGKERQFEAISPLLTPGTGVSAETVAKSLASTNGAVRVALSRLRKRFGQIVEEEVRATLLPEEDFDEEIGFLMSVASR